MQRRVLFKFTFTHKIPSSGCHNMWSFTQWRTAQLPRRLLLLAWSKSNQKIKSAEMLLCAAGLGAQNRGKPWAAIISPGYPFASIPCMRKLAMPWPPRRLAGFPRFFSEALLRTGHVIFLSRNRPSSLPTFWPSIVRYLFQAKSSDATVYDFVG